MIILSTNFQPSGRVASGQKICMYYFEKAPSYLSLSGQAIIVAEVLLSTSSLIHLQTSLRTLMATTPTKETLRNLVKREELELMTLTLVILKLVLL